MCSSMWTDRSMVAASSKGGNATENTKRTPPSRGTDLKTPAIRLGLVNSGSSTKTHETFAEALYVYSAEATLSSGMGLDLGSYLNLFSAAIIIAAALPAMYMSTRITIKPLRLLFVLLASFLIVHGLYHFTYFLGDYSGSDAVAFGDEIL